MKKSKIPSRSGSNLNGGSGADPGVAFADPVAIEDATTLVNDDPEEIVTTHIPGFLFGRTLNDTVAAVLMKKVCDNVKS